MNKVQDLQELINEILERVKIGGFSPVQVAEKMIELEHYRYIYQVTIEKYDKLYREELVSNLKEKMPKSKAEAIAQASESYSMRQLARIEAEHLDKIIGQLKYYQRGVEKEWNNTYG